MENTGPFRSTPMSVEPDWIDYNGHMNMAYYNVLFDRAVEQAYGVFGISADYAQKRRLTTYVAEIHVCYVREVHVGDEVTVTLQILEHDAKRIRYYQEMYHSDGWLAATSEGLTLHIDMAGPKVTPFPDDVMRGLDAMARDHARLPVPERAGRSIGLSKKQSG